MSALRNLFCAKKFHQVCSYLRNMKVKSYFYHPVTLMSIAAIGIPVATIYCNDNKPNAEEKFREPFKLPDTKDLSLKTMIQHSSYVTVNAVLHMVQLTTAAVIDASERYRESAAAEIIVLNQCLEFARYEYMQGDLNDVLIILRADIKQADADLVEYVGFMEYIEKLAHIAAETSFLSGAEYPSFSLSDAIHDAQRRIAKQLEENKATAEELLDVQRQVILKTKKKEVVKKEEDEENVSNAENNKGEYRNDEDGEKVIEDPIDKPHQTMLNNF